MLVDFDATQFDELLDYDGTNFELFAHRLVDTYNPAFAAVGCEEGVELGDCLNEVIGRPHHGSELRKRLRHKHLMNRAVRQAGLPVPASLLARTRDEAAQLAEELRSWPLVIKPKDSSGADGVRLCHNLEDVQTIANLLFSKPNIMNERNTEIVIQSYVPGRKMTVDTISDGGEHFVTSVWLDQVVVTQGGSPVMRGARLLPGSRPDALAAAQAARQCLDALGIQHGPAMMEFIEYNNAFYFIEINARLCGLPVWHEEFQRALNFTQDQIYAAWLCNEVDLRRILAQPYHLARHVWWVAALSTRDAVVRNFHGLDCISRLPSFVCILSCAKGGERIRPTEDLFSFPLTALLSNADEGKIIRDFNAFETIGDDVLFSFH
ncbi:MAG: ATP-grasp domain-containing protein [Hyphomicrobiales bacterium]|nr:ATP-grasp domain-containing protein [Hyphomicrobiales bacterium]MBV8824400.1 ATP-grasp domain-containing protein [Hyphomicrobiales bacterium]